MSNKAAAIIKSLKHRLPEQAALRQLGVGDLPALIELYRRRARWLELRGVHQGALIEAERVAERLHAGAVLGLDGSKGLWACAFLHEANPLWSRHPPVRDEPALYLEQLMTDPAAPSVTRASFLAICERFLAAQGCALLRLDCGAASRPLRRFWQERHYVPLNVVPHPDGYPPVLLHEKRLLPPPEDEVPIEFPDDVLERSFQGGRATLLFVIRGGRMLLIHKKRGLGAGKINGPGGKCEPGETPRACAIRETAEELCIDVAEPEYRGELRYLDSHIEPIHGFVYVAHDFTGTPTETDEARPEWFDLDAIPYERMWADDRMWLPWVIEGESMRAAFLSHGDRIEAARLALGPTPEPET